MTFEQGRSIARVTVDFGGANVLTSTVSVDAQKGVEDVTGKLTADILRARFLSLTVQHYTNWAAIIKSGVFVVAATSAHKLSLGDLPLDDKSRLALLWLASLGPVIVTYATWTGGHLFATAKHNLLDHFLVVLFAIIEYMLFIIIERAADKPSDWSFWYLAYSIHAILGFVLVVNRLSQLNISKEFSPEIRGVAELHLRELRGDRWGPLIAALISLGLFTLLQTATTWPKWTGSSDSVSYWFHFSAAWLVPPMAFLICVFVTLRMLKFLARAEALLNATPLATAENTTIRDRTSSLDT